MKHLPFIVRCVLVVAISMLVSQWAFRGMNLEQDMLRAFGGGNSDTSDLMAEYQRIGPFAGRLFVDHSGLDAPEKSNLRSELTTAGYHLVSDDFIHNDSLRANAALLGGAWLSEHKASSLQSTKAAQEIAMVLGVPGADEAFMHADPLGLMRSFSTGTHAAEAMSEMSKRGIEAWVSPRPYAHESGSKAWQLATSLRGRAYLIGEDLFRYTNEQTIRSDVAVASTISLVLNAAVFILFFRNWFFLAIFFVGSTASWAALSIMLRLCFHEVYPVVFGFASTFFSFNSEYLVHLCGVDASRRVILRRAMLSAAGTTFIGLIALLMSSSPLIQQMAAAAIAGLAGFFLATLPFAKYLKDIRLKPVTRHDVIPIWQTVKYGILRLFGPLWIWLFFLMAGLSVILWYGAPRLQTDITQFRFAPPQLVDIEQHFQKLMPQSINPYAVPIDSLSKLGRNNDAEIVQTVKYATANKEQLKQFIQTLADEVTTKLGSLGLEIDRETVLDPYHLDRAGSGDDIHQTASAMGAPLILGHGASVVIMEKAEQAAQWLKQNITAVKIDPRAYYNDLLTNHARQIMKLFGLSLLAMVLYLVVIQRNLMKVLVIIMPLILYFVGGGGVLAATGTSLNIIHVIGLILVIGFALDYTAIAVSTDFERLSIHKILITGGSTLASFAGLCVSQHPFLRFLGFAVVPGVIVSLFFTVTISKKHVARLASAQLRHRETKHTE